jgi:hypothetical protein
MIKFRKGQIIPRWVGVKTSDRKAQYHLKFGCDISYEGGVLFMETDGCAIIVPYPVNRRMNNGTRKKVNVVFHNGIHVDGSRVAKSLVVCIN